MAIVGWLPPPGAVGQGSVEALPVYAVQGAGVSSPYAGKRVDIYGVVTAVASRGLFLQDAVGDGRDGTSDGIYVYTDKRPTVKPGQCVVARGGRVEEYYEKTELARVKSIVPFDRCGANRIQPAVLPLLRPEMGADVRSIYEPLEGMRVQVSGLVGVVQGPTKRYRSGDVELALLPEAWLPYVDGGRVFQADAAAMNELVYVSGALGQELPDVQWGDVVRLGDADGAAQAVLDYSFGKYQLVLLPGQTVEHVPQARPGDGAVPTAGDEFTICSFNLMAMGSGTDQYADLAAYRFQLPRRAHSLAASLRNCTVIGVQETGTPADAGALADQLRAESGLDYVATSLPGPQSASPDFPLTNSLLTLRSRVQVLDTRSPQGCSPVDYGVEDPGACGRGLFPLFDRPPLVADLELRGSWGEPQRLRVIVNHWKSKGGDENVNAPRRLRQAEFVAELAQEAFDFAPDAQVAVIGDLNDYYTSTTVQALRNGVEPHLQHAFDLAPALDRYTYIYNGGSQLLDHALLSPALFAQLSEVNVLHVDSDFATPKVEHSGDMHHVSDHDPVLLRFRPDQAAWLGGNVRFAGLGALLIAEDGSIAAQGRSDAAGEFRVWNVRPGRYTLTWAAPPYVDPPEDLALTVQPGANFIETTIPDHDAVKAGAGAALLALQPFHR